MNRSRKRLINQLIKIAIVCGLILILFKLNSTIKRNETESVLSSTDLLDQAEKINKERLLTVDKVCKKYKLGIYKDSSKVLFKHPPAPQYSVFYIVRAHNISYCPLYKASSTTWLYNLCLLMNITEKELNNGKEQLSTIARRVINELEYPEADEALRSTKKLLVIRHPFERLLSAYRDKLENSVAGREHGTLHFYKKYGAMIVRQYRNKNFVKPQDDQVIVRKDIPSAAGIEPTWREFVEYLINIDLANYSDDHWIPYYLYCTPCLVKYDIIAKTPLQKAQKFKDEGNVYFKMGKYDEAIALYNNAIDTCPKDNKEELAIYYQNRAAAYEHLRKYSAVKADCTKALELNPRYAKAFLRRGRALEHSNDLEHALEDVTTACVLEGFVNQSALTTADRVLKQLGKQHAQEHWANKKFVLPSKHFIKTYINSFHNDPIFPTSIKLHYDNPSIGFTKIMKALDDQDYDNIISLCTNEIDSEQLDVLPWKMEMLLLRATFYLLLGKHDAALEDFEKIVNSTDASKEIKVNALIKRASLYMQLENPEKSFIDFDLAVNIDPNCSDIYHHRGQVNLLMEKIDEAKEDFQKAVDLNPDFGLAYVQKCYTDYRYAIVKRDVLLVESCLKNFEKAFEKFPDCPECYTLYAEILSETLDYVKADSYFAKAVEKDPYNASIYVHRGLLQLQWTNSTDKAIEYINKALKLDEKCKFGYETLATIEVQRGNYKEAIELFDKALALSRTSMELTHLYSLRDGAKAQLTIQDRFRSDVKNLQNMS